MPTPLLTPAEVCERLGISERSLKSLLRSGAIRAAKIGSAPNSPWRISEEAIADYIERQTVQASA